MVKLIKSKKELIEYRSQEQTPIGFVPTMGNLHQGHISLLERSLSEFESTYFSIFVNPKQFGPQEDFARYPRTLENDLHLIQASAQKFPSKKIIVFAPDKIEDVFPPSDDLKVSVLGLTNVLEGEVRPGHFEGVATVVYRLFEVMRPKRAYFGLKDYQQFLVIKQMVKDLELNIDILGMPIVRESTGLALSSRNQYLGPEEKEKSLVLSRSLRRIGDILNKKRAHLPDALSFIKKLKEDKNWNYLEIRDAETLSEDITHSSQVTVLGVYQLGTTRLLDNFQTELE